MTWRASSRRSATFSADAWITDMSARDLPFLIVGAGIGGLSAALSLARAGFPVHVLEQASELKEIGAGIQLGPNVFRMFDVLGIMDAVARQSVFPDRYQIMDAVTGEELTHMPLGGS